MDNVFAFRKLEIHSKIWFSKPKDVVRLDQLERTFSVSGCNKAQSMYYNLSTPPIATFEITTSLFIFTY